MKMSSDAPHGRCSGEQMYIYPDTCKKSCQKGSKEHYFWFCLPYNDGCFKIKQNRHAEKMFVKQKGEENKVVKKSFLKIFTLDEVFEKLSFK